MAANSDRLKWFQNAGVGMFIHWGVYSVHGRGEWAKLQEKIPDEEYWSHAPRFRAQKYDPEAWVKLARSAGMNYMVISAKHHDGYCLFDTDTTSLNSMAVGPGKDLVAAFVKACRKHRMRVGLYFSLPDWSKPAFFKGPDRNRKGWQDFIAFTHAQVRELLTNYGKIDLLWYDNILGQSGKRQLTAEDYQAKKLSRMVRRLQPGIVVNDRSLLPGDFYTAEQHPSPPADKSRPWEACMTMNKHWGHFPADKMWKTPAEIVNLLTGIAANGGNLLLNVGPRADGTIPQPNARNLEQLGQWMKRNGEAIYGAERCEVNAGTLGVFSRKGNVLYLMVHWWHGKRLVLPDFPYALRSARILGSKHKVCFTRDGKRLILHGLPARAPDPLCTVIAFRRGGKVGTRTPASKQAVVNFRER